MMARREIVFKHMGSILSDQTFKYEIDTEQRVVSVHLETFDTALFEGFVRRLESDHGVCAIADDNEGFTPTRPAWRLKVWIGTFQFNATAARLMDIGGKDRLAVVLKPVRDA